MDHCAVPQETYQETWQNVHREYIWVPSKGRYDRAASATNTERVESIKVGFGGRVDQHGARRVDQGGVWGSS